MAEPTTRPGLPGGFLRRAAGQDPRRRPGAQQGGLRRPRAQRRGREGGAGAVDRADRRRQVLAEGDERTQNQGCGRHPDRRRRRAQGLSRGIGAVFPLTTVQTCIIHLIRNSLAFVSWKDRKLIMPDLKAIHRAETADAAAVELDAFEAEWGKRYPAIGQAWRRAWEHVVPLFAFAPGVRKVIYTTNAVEALHRSLRKIIKTRGSFPNDDAALKLLYLAIKNAGLRWRRGVEWTAAMGQFAIQFGSRFPGSAR